MNSNFPVEELFRRCRNHKGAFAGCLSSTLRRIESVGGDQRWREKLFGDEIETFAEGNLPERGRCSHFWYEHAKDT